MLATPVGIASMLVRKKIIGVVMVREKRSESVVADLRFVAARRQILCLKSPAVSVNSLPSGGRVSRLAKKQPATAVTHTRATMGLLFWRPRKFKADQISEQQWERAAASDYFIFAVYRDNKRRRQVIHGRISTATSKTNEVLVLVEQMKDKYDRFMGQYTYDFTSEKWLPARDIVWAEVMRNIDCMDMRRYYHFKKRMMVKRRRSIFRRTPGRVFIYR